MSLLLFLKKSLTKKAKDWRPRGTNDRKRSLSQKQEDVRFEASLGYMRPGLKQQQNPNILMHTYTYWVGGWH